jgi:hypothetical protein
MVEVFLKNKEFEKKPETRGHLACKQDQVAWPRGDRATHAYLGLGCRLGLSFKSRP